MRYAGATPSSDWCTSPATWTPESGDDEFLNPDHMNDFICEITEVTLNDTVDFDA